jgi:hypothetical protein
MEGIDYINMPIARLDERDKELSASLRSIEHNPERKAQIQKELGDIAFELWCRYATGELEFAPS